MNIREQRTFVDEKGQTIHELIPYFVDFGALVDKRDYFAIGQHVVIVNGQPTPDQFRFDIEADSVVQAFERLEESFKVAQAARLVELEAQFKAMAEQHRRQIVLPSGHVLPPNGKPKTRFK